MSRPRSARGLSRIWHNERPSGGLLRGGLPHQPGARRHGEHWQYISRAYATVWNAHVKDALENRLHELVCDGHLPLATARRHHDRLDRR